MFGPPRVSATTSPSPVGQPSTGQLAPQAPLRPPHILDHAQGVILSPALQPVPARLVQRIMAGDFVEMRDLLLDNIALHDQLEAVGGPWPTQSLPGALRPRLREVPSLISWVFCFTAYIAIRAQDPAIRDMLTYCRLIIREALRHGGQGWQDYDRSFRSQAAIDRSLRWNALLPDLQASTILGQRMSGGAYCSLCRGVDHTVTQCALSDTQQPGTQAHLPSITGTVANGTRRPAPAYARDSRPICASWNAGACTYPNRCNFRHVCSTCGYRHQARDCRNTPGDSRYKQGIRGPAAPSSGR